MNAAITNQKTVPLLPVDAGLLASKNRVDTYRTLIGISLKNNLAPLKVDTAGVERSSIFIHPVMMEKINLAAIEHNLSFQEAFAGLTAAGIESLRASQRTMAGLADEIKAPFNARPEQLRYYQGIQTGLLSNKIVLAEASTGIGKGRVLCATAIESAKAGKTPVVIVAPTLKVLGQLWLQMKALHTEGLGESLSYSFYPGAAEFINDDKLSEFLLDHDKDPAVTAWLKDKGPMLESDNPLRETMTEMGVKPVFLAEDLRKLAINMDIDDFILRGDSQCEAALTLKEIRTKAIAADIIFCTHTMLAMSHKLNWALVPAPALLLIDEAHQFEQNVANVHSDGLSLNALASKLKHGKSPAKTIKAVRELSVFLQSIDIDNVGQINLMQIDDTTINKTKALVETLSGLLKSKSFSKVDRIDVVRRILFNTKAVLSRESTDSSYLSFSPDRRYPTISTGKSNLGLVLGSLWKAIHGGVVLASATLYIKDQYGEDKCDYICDILFIPSSRIHSTTPVIAEWLTSIPKLYTPSPLAAKRLARPKLNDETATKEWINALSIKIENIGNQAKGGTLILTTSYSQIAMLIAKMSALGIPSERIFVQEKNKKLAVTEQEYREAHKKGLRPIWLALGGAWTGLDLSDHNAEEDTLLTDLVIICCPIGLNRSNTMIARIEARSMSPINKESIMMLKQGLGRLMRDPKQTNRNIWFLDGRIYCPWKGMEHFQKLVIRTLLQYKLNAQFDE